MSGLKHITGVNQGRSSKVSVKVPKAQKMPTEIKATIPVVPKIKPSHGVAGTSAGHHAGLVAKALKQPQPLSGRARVPGVPTGNPAPTARVPTRPGIATVFET